MKTEELTEIERSLDDLLAKDETRQKSAAAEKPASEFVVSLKRILVPTDFSDCAKEALDAAVPFARQFGATLIILYVMPCSPEDDFSPSGVNYSGRLLDQLVCTSVPVDIFSKTVVRAGPTADEIVRAAGEFKADLIVMATHGYTGLKHAWFGSTAENVIRHAPCPVVTVRAKNTGLESK